MTCIKEPRNAKGKKTLTASGNQGIVHISGILVHARPGEATRVGSALAALEGVDVHAVTPEGRLVVTVELDDDARLPDTFHEIGALPGVLSAALVYSHTEIEP